MWHLLVTLVFFIFCNVVSCAASSQANNTIQWAWISGSNSSLQPGVYGSQGVPNASNLPGARYGAVGWFDSSTQALWLFGGFGLAANDNPGV